MTDLAGLPPGLEGGLTVVRMIGSLDLQPAAVNLNTYGAFGICVVSRDAVAAGAVPDPITDLVDWYYHVSFYMNQQQELKVEKFPFDIRTKRLIRGVDRTLVAILEVAAAAATGVNFSTFLRLLLMRK